MKLKFLLGLFLCGWSLAQQYSVQNIPDALKKNASIVIRNAASDYTIKKVDEIQIVENNAYTILNKSGAEYSAIYIPYDKQTSVHDIKVTLLDENGKTVKTYSRKDFADYSHTPSFGLYVDNRVLVLNPTLTTYPYTVQYSYRIVSRNTVFISDFSPLRTFNVAAQSVKRTIRNESGISLRTKVTNTDLGNVAVSTSGNVTEYAFQNIPAVERQPFCPSMDYLAPKVEFALDRFNLEGIHGELKNWNDFGKWYYQNLLSPSTIISPEIKAEVQALNLQGSVEDKVRTIFQYMQNKTRYVFVAMGIGGWQPMTTEEVRTKGYGDCKGLTNYMRALLMAAGIPSHYAVINSDVSVEKFDPDFPKMGGNHAILVVPTEKGNIWLENTSQNIAFNHLSYTTTSRNVLAVKDNGIELMNTPVYPAERNTEKIRAYVKINPDQTIHATADFQYGGGQYDFRMPMVTLSGKERAEAMKEDFNYLNIQNLTLDHFTNDRNKAEINYKLNIHARDYSRKLGEDLFFPVIPFYKTAPLVMNDERKLPFETVFGYQDSYEITYESPQGYAFTDLPEPQKVTSEFGTYSINYKMNGDKLHVTRNLTIQKGIYPKEKYAAYVEFRKKTANLDNSKILITKI